jgi:hypothetical protein
LPNSKAHDPALLAEMDGVAVATTINRQYERKTLPRRELHSAIVTNGQAGF